MNPPPDVLDAERAYLLESRKYLGLMRDDVLSLRALGGDPVSEEFLKAELYHRAEALQDLPDTPLFFGRLDYGPGRDGPGRDGLSGDGLNGESFHNMPPRPPVSLDAASAVLQAARMRLRPILMTSFAFIMGVIPLVLASGAGAEIRHAMGITVFAGMLGVTFFGLLLTPVFYVLVRRMTESKKAQTDVETPTALAAPEANHV